ncbi:MAG: L-seryl-tRNA(Sec) selenium transferase [Planctomycetaceae bacterium]|nr:L-seryl-tRNA(Sec) selenium transferase [Planctomycetales bacterium]MCB9924839.1 L-seryl-tRNA(Sec) selenium transferase [Planctomycetaceae bacterium]
MQNPLRSIPSVNELLERPELKNLVDRVSHNVVVTEVRGFLERLREDVQSTASEMNIPTPGELAERIADWIVKGEELPLRPVINATGILLHTGLGRAPLAKEAVQAMADVAEYASVELDLATGERSQRVAAVEKLLKELTGAEAAAVVNNNAAATLLTLAALGCDKEVIVSRGQLIEIGGSYRLPDVMSASGTQLREVGTTNKTRIGDFEAAISEETAALMRVHTSNFKVVGFTEEPTLAELVALGRKQNLPVIDDIGSGALIDFGKYGIHDEPIASVSIKSGADLVLFSGDKLVGGPQCGIIVGKKSLVQKIAKHPMMRAMRVDKLILAALAATLRLYRDVTVAEESLPLLARLSAPVENLRNRAERLAPQLAATAVIKQAEAIEGNTYLGGGSVPTQQIPTWCVALTPEELNVDDLSKRLRMGSPSVVGRIQQDRLLLDLRSVLPHQDGVIVEAVSRLEMGPGQSSPDSPPNR